MKARLSDQADKIKDGNVPFPMYTCLHVKSNVSAKVFQEWYEFTPYEVSIPKYGVNFKTSDFAAIDILSFCVPLLKSISKVMARIARSAIISSSYNKFRFS